MCVGRKLAAMLVADVVGYSKLMAEDESGTLARLKEHRSKVFDPNISQHNGRIIKLMGDGALVEFASVVDAVECALAIQSALANGVGFIQLRIAVNLGDVIIDGDDIYGDGVNIAARLEALAEPGGICISSIVHESLGNRIDATFADGGEHKVKNINRPIRIFRWKVNGADSLLAQGQIPAELTREHTISVSPFENVSDDPELGYFCEGVAEDIITAFGNIAQLTVVSGENQTTGGEAAESDREAAHYVLAGKVRKSGSRMRVSAQLVDRLTGVQRWADRFDRYITDLFEVQDDVTRNIVIGVHTELGAGAYTNTWQWGTNNFEAWKLMAKGFREFQKWNPDSMIKTIALWEQALAVDPDYLAPLMGAGYCYSYMALVSDTDAAQIYIEKAQAAFEKSFAAAPNDVRLYSAKRELEIALGNHDEAIAAAQTALDMEPNNAACRGTLAVALMTGNRPVDALAQGDKAAREMSDPPGWLSMTQSLSHFMLGNLAEAIQISRETIFRIPDFYPGPILTAAFASKLGLTEEAAAMQKKVLQMDPQFSADLFVRSHGFKNVEHHEKLLGALIEAGLPE
jgi:adenylate cyclase